MDSWVCPNDRQLALRAKYVTALVSFSMKLIHIGSQPLLPLCDDVLNIFVELILLQMWFVQIWREPDFCVHEWIFNRIRRRMASDDITYRLCVRVYKCLHDLAAQYLSELCRPVTVVPARQHLRSASRGQL